MPSIVFDVLIPVSPDAATNLGETFQRALDILVSRGRLSSGTVSTQDDPLIDDSITRQLREVYARDHDGKDAGDARIHRYIIDAAGDGISYNELAMGLSRILMPQADLPRDPVALERELDFEQASLYPWTVEIRR